jgi:hypothetical protein
LPLAVVAFVSKGKPVQRPSLAPTFKHYQKGRFLSTALFQNQAFQKKEAFSKRKRKLSQKGCLHSHTGNSSRAKFVQAFGEESSWPKKTLRPPRKALGP